MKLRLEIIYSKLKELKNSLFYLNDFLPSDAKFLENRKDKNSLFKEAEVAIQYVIDICSVINSDVSKIAPNDEDSIFISLEKERIISKELSKKLRTMKGFRNLLVHRYGEVDNDIAYDDIKNGLKDFEKFIIEIEKFLTKNKSGKKK